MWCRHCQQDVPAIAAWASGPLLCPRCEFAIDKPIDVGIELETFTPPRPAAGICTALPRIDDDSLAKLRQLGQKLRAPHQHDLPAITSPRLQPPPVRAPSPSSPDAYRNQRTGTGWFVSLLLAVGVATFAVGIAMMLYAAIGPVEPWYGALVATLAGEGALIVGLSWMAVRLWKNSRRVNRQLSGVAGQLTDIQLATGDLAAARMTNSQAYYQHFGSAASPTLVLTNLRGQLDELSSRIAA